VQELTDRKEPTVARDEKVERMEFLLSLRRRGISDQAVLRALDAVPREQFVLPEFAATAYADSAMPIACGQTISQPYVVAYMSEQLEVRPDHRVLEIGTGSGYAAAILGAIVREVDTVERIEELALAAASRLAQLGFTNVHVHCADGTRGWPLAAPYEAIAVSAGAPRPPQSLLDQLEIGGRLVLPHGDPEHQQLVRITRRDRDRFDEEDLGEVRFVPLLGAEGWPERR